MKTSTLFFILIFLSNTSFAGKGDQRGAHRIDMPSGQPGYSAIEQGGGMAIQTNDLRNVRSVHCSGAIYYQPDRAGYTLDKFNQCVTGYDINGNFVVRARVCCDYSQAGDKNVPIDLVILKSGGAYIEVRNYRFTLNQENSRLLRNNNLVSLKTTKDLFYGRVKLSATSSITANF
ncbi:MAG: hypothetical protein OEY33_02455 [Bdellovibrionales bacterium]|nr:hypothetical protein [Bdellovibrionales bacterium]